MTGKDAMLGPFRRALTALVSLVMLAMSLTVASPTALAQNSLADALRQQSEFLPVREAYQLDGAVTREGQLRLYWRIAEGYYLYQHAFKVVTAGTQLTDTLPLDLPPAIAKTDEFFGDVSVYYDEVDLRLSLTGDGGPYTLAVSYQGCADAGLCYPPETEYLRVNVSSGSVATASAADMTTRPPAQAPANKNMSLLLALGLAFLGGLILNAMPCVFPILSLKVLTFAAVRVLVTLNCVGIAIG